MGTECKKDTAYKALTHEYISFKNMILLKNNEEIYNSYGSILFYESLYEYFSYNENIEWEVWAVLYNNIMGGTEVFAELYNLFLKYEQFNVSTWEGIDELMEFYRAGRHAPFHG